MDLRSVRVFFTPVMILLSVMNGHAEDWPQWRGPRNNGVSTETSLPAKWSKTENVEWRVELPGPAPSTPVVWGDRIFLTSVDGNHLVLMSISTAGKTLWKQTVASGNSDIRQGESNMAAPSPSTDGKHVWAMFGTGDLACYDFDGNQTWKFNVQDRYNTFRIYWGMSSSPLLDGDRLYLLLLHTNQQSVIALDKLTGEEIWHHHRKTNASSESLHSYASPIMYRSGEQEWLLTHGADFLVAHDPDTGREVWRCGGLQNGLFYNPMYRLVATPVAAEGVIVVPSAKNGPVLAIDPERAWGNITNSDEHILWKRDDNTPDVPSPLIHGGLVYLCRENGHLLCLDARTGEEIYHERPHRSRHRSSPVVADGKLYLIGMDGTVTVVKAGRQFEILAQNKMGERTAASLAISEGTIYLRTYEALYAISE